MLACNGWGKESLRISRQTSSFCSFIADKRSELTNALNTAVFSFVSSPSSSIKGRIRPITVSKTAYSSPKYSCNSRRIRLVMAGLWPAVEIATVKSPRFTVAGTMKLHSSGRSAMLHSIPRSSHNWLMRRLTSSLEVQAMTRNFPFRSLSLNSRQKSRHFQVPMSCPFPSEQAVCR